MRRPLQDRRILITGATGGLGFALSQSARQRGACLALVSRSITKLQDAVAGWDDGEGRLLLLEADLTSREDRARLIASVLEKWRGLDVLVNNAGVGSFGHFIDSDEAILRQVMELNFFAPAELLRLALPLLRLSTAPGVVNIGSMCGRRALPAWSEYSASKYALCGLSDSLRAELARFDIPLLLVNPGLTSTGLGGHLLLNRGRMPISFDKGMPPSFVAEKVWNAFERGQQELVIGSEARWLLGLNRWLPGLVNRLMSRKVRVLYADEIAARGLHSSHRPQG